MVTSKFIVNDDLYNLCPNGVTVIEGTFDKMYGESQAARLSIRQGIQEEGVKGFPDVVVSTNVSDGICHL